MSQNQNPPLPDSIPCGLNVEQLDVGLRILADDLVDVNAFWDDNITAFRQTLLSAIRETSDALLSPTISLSWRIELDGQLECVVVVGALGLLHPIEKEAAALAWGVGQRADAGFFDRATHGG